MIDLSQILPLVQGLGPVGWGIAALMVWLQWKNKKPADPKTPAGPATPGPLVPAVPDLADAALRLLMDRLRQRFPRLVAADADDGDDLVREYHQIRGRLEAEQSAANRRYVSIADALAGKAKPAEGSPF